MTDGTLRVLMINHHRRSKVNCINRSMAMAKHLARRGHQITLLTTSDHQRSKIIDTSEESVHVVEIPDLLWGALRSGWDPWSALCRFLYLSRINQNFDLIHLFESRPAVIHPVQIYRATRSIPMIIDWVDWIGRGGILEVRRPRWYRYLFGSIETFYEEYFRARADGLTVICTTLRERAVGLGIVEDAILHIPVGADLQTYATVLDKSTCRHEVNLPQENAILAFAAVDADFDLPIVLGALKQVVRLRPETRLMLLGKSNPYIMRLAREYDIDDRIFPVGYVPFDRFPVYLGCADIFLLPFPNTLYNRGRWPSKICDYMASGRPIISNPTGDIKDLFTDNDVGILVGETIDDWIAGILSILEQPEIASRKGRNARRTAETVYNWSRLAETLEAFYFRTLEHTGTKVA